MDKRTMYNLCKAFGSIYADFKIKDLINDLGSLKRWDAIPVVSDEVEAKMKEGLHPLFKNRIGGRMLNKDLQDIVLNDNGSYSLIEQTSLLQTASNNNRSSEQEEEIFTQHQKDLCESIIENRIYNYGAGDRIYDRIGVLNTGANDHSMTFGFELETNRLFNNLNQSNFVHSLDKCLGHFETDASVTGVEFDTHIFTYDMLQKAKPAFKKMFNAMEKEGLIAERDNCGIHIHVGRNAFTADNALAKFYYLINTNEARLFWKAVARRESSYAAFNPNINRTTTLQQLKRIMENQRGGHSVACNQQHSSTIEVRIFQSTFNIELIYDYIRLIKNLVDICNSSCADVKYRDLINGTTMLYGTLPSYETSGKINISHIFLSRDSYKQDLINAINDGNMELVLRLGREYQEMFGSDLGGNE